MWKKHVIFDLDGTTFDTEYEVSRITADLAREKGFSVSDDEVFRDFAGLGTHAKFSGIAKRFDTVLFESDLKELDFQHEHRKQQFYLADKIPVVSGIPEILQALADAGHLLSVGSSNPSARSRLGLTKTGLARHFGARIYGPDLAGGLKKPDPAVFLLAMKDNGSTPENTIVVEDTEPGMEAGRAAGAFVVAYLDPRFGDGAVAEVKMRSFRAAGANVIVRNFDAEFLLACVASAPGAASLHRKKNLPDFRA